jgi:diguanylate cyclase (GGDEF)-like protein/PAS domain S-box-containing protein
MGVKLKWYTGSYAWWLTRLIRALCSQEDLNPTERAELLVALVKLIFFDMSLAIDTYLKADLDQIQALTEHLKHVLDAVPEAILTVDAQGQILRANPAAEHLFGQPTPKLLGQALERFLTDERGRPLTLHALLAHLWRPGSPPLPANTAQFPVEITTTPLPEDFPQYLVVARDVSQQKQAEQKLLKLANFDPLTSLPNRNLFFDRLTQALAHAHRHRELVALAFLDLDDFKKINDSLGHLMGDRLLVQVAQRLQEVLRASDTLARFGGDEFVFILPELKTCEGYVPVVTKLLETFALPFRLGTQEVFAHASLGIALFPHHGTDPNTLLKHADAAMYEAKRLKVKYYCYNPALEAQAAHKLTVEGELYRALERQEFFPVYQPQVELSSGRILGVEALLRWSNPNLGEVSPGHFLPLLEHSGLIHEVGAWMLRTALAQLSRWQTTLGRELTLALNLSVYQLSQPDFAQLVYRELQAVGLSPGHLELEVTEHLFLAPSETVLANLEALCAIGVRLAIDDFGTGYASLACLKSFPFHTLKIDKSFIQHLTTDKDLLLAQHIVGIGKSLGLSVIAEGVETPSHLELVKRLGCDLVQGYFFSPPVKAQGLTELLLKPWAIPN